MEPGHSIKSKLFSDVPITATTATEAVRLFLSHASHGPPTTFRFVNAGTLDAAAGDSRYQEILGGQGINLPDGQPLAAVLRRTAPLDVTVEQVRGPWFFEECLNRGRQHDLKHFFLGSTDATLKSLTDQVLNRFPGVNIVGTYSPPFKTEQASELAARDASIRASGANIVWVALGTPKQDAEALRVLRSTGLTTAAVGAAFDFTARTKPVAPALVRRAHLEWLFRLLSEPRRLWRRYLVGNTRFILATGQHFYKNARS